MVFERVVSIQASPSTIHPFDVVVETRRLRLCTCRFADNPERVAGTQVEALSVTSAFLKLTS